MLQQHLHRILAPASGNCSVMIRDTLSGENVSINDATVHPAASLIKLFILLEFFRQVESGRLALHERVLIQKEHLTGGFGILKELQPGLPIAYLDLATLMIIVSDNIATNMLIDRLGIDRINDTIRAGGFTDTVLNRRMMDHAAKEQGLDNFTSARDVFNLLERLVGGKLLPPPLTERFIDILKRQQCNNKLPLCFPEGTVFAHKTGDLPNIEHDAGILYLTPSPIIVVVMIKDLPCNAVGICLVHAIGYQIHEYFTSTTRQAPRKPGDKS